MTEAVGGRLILEAGDAVDIYELDIEHEVRTRRPARVKYTATTDRDGRHGTLGIFPEPPTQAVRDRALQIVQEQGEQSCAWVPDKIVAALEEAGLLVTTAGTRS